MKALLLLAMSVFSAGPVDPEPAGTRLRAGYSCFEDDGFEFCACWDDEGGDGCVSMVSACKRYDLGGWVCAPREDGSGESCGCWDDDHAAADSKTVLVWGHMNEPPCDNSSCSD